MIVKNMKESEYRSHPAISRSDLFKIQDSPEKFKYHREHPSSPTPALLFGQALHKLVLQPETFDNEFAVAPEVNRRTKAGKEAIAQFEVDNADKTVITAEMYTQAAEMRDALYSHYFVRKLLDGDKEISYFWEDELTGEACKCKADCVTEVMDDVLTIVDLKTTSGAGTDEFMRSAIKYGYDFQCAMYSEGIEKCTGRKTNFVIIAVEKEPPYAVNILQADELFRKRGTDLFRELLGIYHYCKQNDDWFGYMGKDNIVNKLCLPSWLAKEVE